MQRVHFQIRVGVFNCQDNDFFDIVVKTNRMWFSVVYSLLFISLIVSERYPENPEI